MARKLSGLSARAARAVGNAKHIPDSEIDFSDIPESTDAATPPRPPRWPPCYRQCQTFDRHPHRPARSRQAPSPSRQGIEALPNLHPRNPRTRRQQESRLRAFLLLCAGSVYSASLRYPNSCFFFPPPFRYVVTSLRYLRLKPRLRPLLSASTPSTTQCTAPAPSSFFGIAECRATARRR